MEYLRVEKILVIGAGISGLSIASILKDAGNDILVFERSSNVGGLVKCSTHEGVLFHRVGGHVFNAKNKRVSNWLCSKFDKQFEFISSARNAKIFMDNMMIGYPIENNIHHFPLDIVQSVVKDLMGLTNSDDLSEVNFRDFLLSKFGKFPTSLEHTNKNLPSRHYQIKFWDEIASFSRQFKRE